MGSLPYERRPGRQTQNELPSLPQTEHPGTIWGVAGKKGEMANGINLSITSCGVRAKQRCRANAINVQSRLAFRVFCQNSRVRYASL